MVIIMKSCSFINIDIFCTRPLQMVHRLFWFLMIKLERSFSSSCKKKVLKAKKKAKSQKCCNLSRIAHQWKCVISVGFVQKKYKNIFSNFFCLFIHFFTEQLNQHHHHIIVNMSRRQQGSPWPSLTTCPLLLGGLQGYILYRHKAVVYRF